MRQILPPCALFCRCQFGRQSHRLPRHGHGPKVRLAPQTMVSPMCGIAGLIDLKRQLDGNELALQAKHMAASIRHRGPDTGANGRILRAVSRLAFAGSRLSISRKLGINQCCPATSAMRSSSMARSIIFKSSAPSWPSKASLSTERPIPKSCWRVSGAGG